MKVKIVLIAVLAMLFSIQARAQKKQDVFVFTPQWTAQAQFAGYYAALEKGFYEEEGLNVVIEHPNASRTATDRMKRGQSHATTSHVAQAIEALDNGVQLVNLLQTSMNSSTMIVSRRGVDPLTQKGARVACFRAGYSQFAKALSQKMGLDYKWIESAGLLNLFVAGAVDASLAMSYNEYYQFLQTGLIDRDSSIVCCLKDHGYNIQEDGLYISRKEYNKNPERALKFARASKKGWEWVANHREEALEIVMTYVKTNHIATNRYLQKLMLEDVLDLMEDSETGEREYLLREDMFNQAVDVLLESGQIKKEHTIKELLP